MKMKKTERTQRDTEIIEAHRNGETTEAVSSRYGLSRQMVWKIINKAGLNRHNAGPYGNDAFKAKRKKQAQARQRIREARCLEVYGLPYWTMQAIFEQYKGRRPTPWGAFQRQRHTARRRDVKWDLTFGDWWRAWLDSGQWEQRGRKPGQYCLTREDMRQGFTKDNIHICLTEEKWEHVIPGQTPMTLAQYKRRKP